jgi:hypothetical protein
MSLHTFNLTLLILITLSFGNGLFAQETPSNAVEELQKLRQKVAELQQQLSSMQIQLNVVNGDSSTGGSGEVSELEKALAQELGAQPQTGPTQQSQVSQETMSARRSFFQGMNPNISVVGSLLGSANSLDGAERNVDLIFQEGEFAFQAIVDPYARADFYVAFGRHLEPLVRPVPEEEEEHGHGLEAEIEEAYITLLSLPFHTQLKAGKFRSRFGKLNETHPHAYNFVDVPLMYQNFFGPEGLNDEGASLNWLTPNPAFFQELTFQVTSGPAENASFVRAETNRLLYLAHLKNFFDVTDNTTLELGVTGLSGPNIIDGASTNMLAGDLTLKWKPLQQNRYKSFELMSELLISKRNGIEDVTSFGMFSFARYQIAKRWFLGGMYDYTEFPEFTEVDHWALSGVVQFLASEFQKVELQYKYNDGNFFDSFSELKLRAIFVIGAHGAHQY